ncbi:MAG: M4 family metallopeptidase [Bacteroidota bacterium]|nr:M4 family metallopeptidase [Bacteroidota bacterium]
MKNLRLLLSATLLSAGTFAFAQSNVIPSMQEFHGNAAAAIFPGSKTVLINKQSRVPSFIIMRSDANIPSSEIFERLRTPLKMQLADGWNLRRADKDNLGFTHYRYNQAYNTIKVEGGEYLVHERNGRVESVNGMWMDGITLNTNPSLAETAALQSALNFTNAQLYKWQVPADEAAIKHIKNDVNATWYPKGELVIVCADNDIFKREYHLAWKFDIYSLQPFGRKYIYVDAQSGMIVAKSERIHETDVPATGTSLYSGTINFTCDNYAAGLYRLHETARGQGIETYNANNSTNQANATEFVNSSATWTATANFDNAAYDAHWGAEKTYDYYSLLHGRNGIDNAGMLMVSYVHYDNGLDNAFWDGTSMSYGDGSQSPGNFNPLVGIDVCGHEFSHGVTEFSCNLDYQYESGAINESFSDCMGTAIEYYAKPLTGDFLIGEEVCVTAGDALRDMQNPNAFGDPDTYNGTNWYTGAADNGGVHTNSGVLNHWFYIMSMGEAGTNDLGDAYAVTGLGITSAADILYRGHTVYLVSTSQYADCRVADIQSAIDIYGACTPEVEATTNAWYAVGVGAPYSSVVAAAFTADLTTSCNLPMTVNFTNNSANATNATWYFGDATTSTVYSPTHIYTQPGTYTISLAVNSACGTDSIVQSSYITINPPPAPTGVDQNSCSSATFNLVGNGTGTLSWYANPTGGTPLATGSAFTTPVLNSTTTYYLENQVAQAPGNAGPIDNTFGGGGQHNNTSIQYLEFTVFTPCTLATGDVVAGSAGNKTFILYDNAGNPISNYVVNCPATGLQTVTLNIPLTPGSYRLGGTQMNLYRNNAGANYPYDFPNVVSITGSSAGGNYYYYLYNWTITLPACTSVRVPVTATIGSLNIAFSTAAFDTVCMADNSFALSGGSPSGGTYSGPGVTAGAFDPTVAGTGSHTIVYTYTDSANCTGTIPATVVVDDCTGILSPETNTGVSVYPNPANSFVTVELQLGTSQEVELNLVNMLGQTLYTSKANQSAGVTKVNINTIPLPRGVYLLQVKTENGMQVRKGELQ